MSRLKQVSGLDAVDVGIHLALTAAGLAFFFTRPPEVQKASDYIVVAAVSLLAFAVRRRLALNAERRAEGPSGADTVARLTDDLQARLGEIDELRARLAEVEERQDFSERMLATKVEPAMLEGPRA